MCGVRITGGPHTGTPSYLRRVLNRGSGRLSIKAEPHEDYARDLALVALDRPDLANALASSGDRAAIALTDQLATDEHRLNELAEGFADGAITREQLAAGTRKLMAWIEAARQRIATANGNRAVLRYVGRGQELRAAWQTMTLDQRRR